MAILCVAIVQCRRKPSAHKVWTHSTAVVRAPVRLVQGLVPHQEPELAQDHPARHQVCLEPPAWLECEASEEWRFLDLPAAI